MDNDEQHSLRRSPQHTNALAGPSTMPEMPPLYLPPPGPPQPRPYFTSTQDLLTRFQLLPSYDKYVRPFAPPVGSAPAGPSATEKGKGKEKDALPRDAAASSPAAHTPGAALDGEEEEGGKGEKKFKNYRHLIKGIPGKHSMKKDDYLTNLIQIPPKQKIAIAPFDLRTQRDAFSVSLEGLKGWNIHVLVAESSQAREDRKRRKQAKAQAQGLAQPAAGLGPNTPSALPATPAAVAASPPVGATSSAAPPRTSTPRPGVPKPPPGQQQSLQPRGRTPVGIGTPHSIPTPGPGAGVPPPVAAAQHGAAAQTSPSAHPSEQLPTHPMRGVKREREYSTDTGLQVNGNMPPVAYSQDGSRPVVKGAKAGIAGVRPRPVKKQRLDTNGHAQVPIQQPTPHA
ncbi:hypothetical protein C8Q77DRAFT_1051982 [Trametes polyzona]|nr:hypothetical protein C8Q77DRAFT_1051982 [Trametes polyzona]